MLSGSPAMSGQSKGTGARGQAQSTISKSNASAAVSRAGSLARNARSRSALSARLGHASRGRGAAAASRSRHRSPGGAAPAPSGAAQHLLDAAACAWSRSANSGFGSASSTVSQGSSTAAGVVPRQRLAQEAAPLPHLGHDVGPGLRTAMRLADRERRRRADGEPAAPARGARMRAGGRCTRGTGTDRRGGRGRAPASRPGRPGPSARLRAPPARSTVRSSIAHRSSSVSTTSRGLALRRIAVSLSASSRSIRSTSPGSSRSR